MIPLVRPSMPSPTDFWPMMSDDERSGSVLHFGPCYGSVISTLARMTGKLPVTASSHTGALRIAIQTAFQNCQRTLKIAVPEFGPLSLITAVIESGYIPVIAPCDPVSWCIDAEWLFSDRDEYDGFIVLSPYGHRVNFDLYDRMSREMNRPVTYDLGGGWGIVHDRTRNPVVFDLGRYSNLFIGGGGICFFGQQDVRRAERAIEITCFDMNEKLQAQSKWGTDSAMSAIQCAMIAHQLRFIRGSSRKKELIATYQSHLLDRIVEQTLYIGSAPSLCLLQITGAEKIEKDGLRNAIEFRRVFYPMLSQMPALSNLRAGQWGIDTVFNSIIAFPSDASDAEAASIIDFIRNGGNHEKNIK